MLQVEHGGYEHPSVVAIVLGHRAPLELWLTRPWPVEQFVSTSKIVSRGPQDDLVLGRTASAAARRQRLYNRLLPPNLLEGPALIRRVEDRRLCPIVPVRLALSSMILAIATGE
jgi:hypothetical protein